MAKSKKFGTFSGVFTPSILTILGVIMYLRLPWIAGQAGLLVTLGIVLLAHLISITTGLSVSSIATDKKVKAGGTYYMISRSLGLSIGGTLGLALFVGLSFSVSLYLIGFSESFLNYWGYEVTKNSIRFTGSILLLAVTIVSFISTKLAIRTQYIIMTAIVLSLVSIFFGDHNFVPAEPRIFPTNEALPFIVLFGIFFPAVTGFEAGVSMSGDLQNPKKSIPGGTIAAIIIGLIVYIGLAFFYSYSVSADLLVNNPNALLEISLIPELVIAGIWGATLSSAFGSILGAPRILQATAVDKISPRIFGKGYGPLNEPRNALVFTFVIAEAGILIGELDVIARIVSMFFITTYGFLNLSCTVESWASSDFRPDFKIPKSVSLIGAVACFVVMIQLDFLAMVFATVILGGLFFYLKNKELRLETGDAWDSVWSTIVRKGLAKLNRRGSDPRNWRPNILLFSGGVKARPHLVDMGKLLTGKLGILSNFRLFEDPDSTVSLRKIGDKEEILPAEEGIFTRSFTAKNLYEGIDSITRIYGFSGVEPNTILMGWGRNTRNPANFARLIKNFNELDLNSLYLNYHSERGFGEKKTIDVWWRGAGNNFILELSLVRFITTDPEWRDAEVRFLIISNNSSVIKRVYQNMNQILEQYRVSGEVKIINNEIERRRPFDIIQAESADTDLVIFGIADISESNAEQVVNSINRLTKNMGSTLLAHASSYFTEVNVGIEKDTAEKDKTIKPKETCEIRSINNLSLENELKSLCLKVESYFEDFINESSKLITDYKEKLNNKIADRVTKAFDELNNIKSDGSEAKNKIRILRGRVNLISSLKKIIQDEIDLLDHQSKIINDNLENLFASIDGLIKSLPDKLPVHFGEENLIRVGGESLKVRIIKSIKRTRHKWFRSPISIQLRYKEYVKYYLNRIIAVDFFDYLNGFEILNYKILSEINNSQNQIFQSFSAGIDFPFGDREFNIDSLKKLSRTKTAEHIDFLSFETRFKNYETDLFNSIREYFQHIMSDAERLNANSLLGSNKRKNKVIKRKSDLISKLPSSYAFNSRHLLNSIMTDLYIEELESDLAVSLELLERRLDNTFDDDYYSKIEALSDAMNNSLQKIEKGGSAKFDAQFNDTQDLLKQFSSSFESIRNNLESIPLKIEVISEKFGDTVESEPFTEGETIELSLRKLIEFYIESEFIGNIQEKIYDVQLELRRSSEALKDIVTLTNFNLDNFEGDNETELAPAEQRKRILEDSVIRLKKESEKIFLLRKSIAGMVRSSLKLTFDPLSSYLIVKSSKELGTHVRELGGKKVATRYSEIKGGVSEFVQRIVVGLFYKRSEGILFAKKISTGYKRELNVTDVYKLADSVTPGKELLQKLPFYYRKLFSGRATVSDEFWVGRSKELSVCSRAVERFKSGYEGGLLIIGEKNDGKTSLSKRTAEKYFNSDEIYVLNPPASGTTDPEKFEIALSSSMNSRLSIDEIFQNPFGAGVVILNDLELWWERNDEGFRIIDRVMGLISSSAARWFFIINMNQYAYKFIKNLKTFDQYFIEIVKCESFDAEELKEIILRRHRASGMRFRLNNADEEDLTELKLAKLFNYYFDYSKGNIGTALNGWLKNIVSIEGNILNIKYPESKDFELIEHIPDDWLIYIIGFLMHRRMDLDKAKRVMQTGEAEAAGIIDKLRRGGLIREYDKGIYELNPYVETFLINILSKMELI